MPALEARTANEGGPLVGNSGRNSRVVFITFSDDGPLAELVGLSHDPLRIPRRCSFAGN